MMIFFANKNSRLRYVNRYGHGIFNYNIDIFEREFLSQMPFINLSHFLKQQTRRIPPTISAQKKSIDFSIDHLFYQVDNLAYLGRGRENRTPIRGFGDRCTTIVRYPY